MIALSELARAVADFRGDGIVVTGPGAMAGAMWAAGHHPASIYNMELAYATSLAYGMALARADRRAIALEGDGSLLAGLPVLATVARQPAPNLVIVAVVNGIYGTGDNLTETQFAQGGNLAAVAVGLGWHPERVLHVAAGVDLAPALRQAVAETGPWLIVAHTDPASYGLGSVRVRPGIDVVESAIELRRYLAASDGR